MGLRQFPGGIPPIAGCGMGTATGWSANDKPGGARRAGTRFREGFRAPRPSPSQPEDPGNDNERANESLARGPR